MNVPKSQININVCQQLFRATLRVRLDSCLSLLLKWTILTDECTFHINIKSLEGLSGKRAEFQQLMLLTVEI